MGEKTKAVVNYFINFANESGSQITHLKLQKLVYYADAWSLAIRDKVMVDDDFQAWQHGPVLRSVYDEFRDNRWMPINRDVDFDNDVKGILSEEEVSFLEEVAGAYFQYDAYMLELMTHQEQPWIEARGSLPPTASCSNLINKETMRNFFRSRIGS